jgi:hypothetical protein
MEKDNIYFKKILLESWLPRILPALITAILGGVLVAWLAPKFQTYYALKTAYHNDRISLWKDIGNNFTNYRIYMKELDVMVKYETKLTKLQRTESGYYQNIKEYVRKRNHYRDQLQNDLLIATYYFNGDTKELIDRYITWDKITSKTITYQPKIAQERQKSYAAWQDNIMMKIMHQLQ